MISLLWFLKWWISSCRFPIASFTLPAPGDSKNWFTLENMKLLKKINKIAINSAVIKITENSVLLSWRSFQPNNKANSATMTRPIYPLSLSKSTVATICLGFLVCAARSTLRTKSPPIVEGKNMLKNMPPANEITILFKGSLIWAASSNIFQRQMHKR